MVKRNVWILLSFCALLACEETDQHTSGTKLLTVPDTLETVTDIPLSYPFLRNGKYHRAEQRQELYEQSPLDTFPLPIITKELVEGLEQQLRLLELRRQKRTQQISNLRLTVEELEETVEILKGHQYTIPINIGDQLDAYQIWGNDRKGNVKFTGYYTPVIKVRSKKNKRYRYPLYNRPRDWEGPLPTRAEIEGEGALDSLGLELAYAKDRIALYYMHVQGSGFVEYSNGKRKLFSYNGSNKKPYRSIERFLANHPEYKTSDISINGIRRFIARNPTLADTLFFHNPSFTFFNIRTTLPKGAGHVPLMAHQSIAVDKRYIPLGSCLLAAIPIYDFTQRRIVKHEYRFLLAQDVGAAIKGPGHVDLYTGIGEKAQADAEQLHHFGKLWLLLPKKEMN